MHHRYQFSLKTLMIVTSAVAVACWIFFQVPVLGALMLSLISTLAASAVISAIVYCEGSRRAFAIGCVAPIAVWLAGNVGSGVSSRDSFHFIVLFLVFVPVTLLGGYISMTIREWTLRESRARRGDGES